MEGPLTTNIRPAKIDALVPGILEVYRDLDLGVDKKEARRIASMQIGRDAQAKKPTLETSFSGSGLYGEDDPGLHATVNPDQSRNSVNPVDLSDHPQETHYPFSLADLSKPGSQDDTPMISRKVKNFLQLHEDPYLGEPWDNPHASGLTERKSSLPSWESLSNLPESLGNTGSSMEENDSGQMPLASETASMKRFRSEVETLDLDNNPIIGALGLEFTDQGTLKEEHISILDKEIAKYPKIPEKKISEDDREKIKKMLQIRRCHYNALLQQTTDNSRRLKAEIDESQTKQRPYEGMQIDHQARQAGLEERKNEYQARVVSSIDSAREEVLNSDTYKQLENTEYPSDDQNTTLSMYKAFIDLTDNIKAEIEASNTNIDIEGEMSELYKNINKMPDDDLMYFIHIDTIISAFGIMKEMGGDLSHIQSCKEELKSLNAGKSEWEQPLQELQRNLEGLENEQKASHREEKRIRQQLIDDEFTFQAYAGVPKPKRQKKQSGIEPLEEEIEAPGGIKSRSRREVVDTHTASLDSNALKQEVFDIKQLGHVKEHKKGGVETELSKYVEGLIVNFGNKLLISW